MANITQQIPNFLGGVSTQPDVQKDVNQVKQIINGYPDPTSGLIKRPGFKWISNIVSDSSYDNAHWFYFRYSSTEQYVGAIISTAVKMWNTSDGTAVTIANNTGQSYLTVTGNAHNQFHVISRQDQIIIVNKSKTAAMSAALTGTLSGTVASIANLPAAGSNNNNVYKIANTGAADDDYYVKSDGTTWNESHKPDISVAIDASTMPHRLRRTGTNAFTFEANTWVNRLVGDTTTNPNPSFIGQTIKFAFFANNRLGFLSNDNVILGVPNETYNFFSKSAIVQIDSDPIDLNCGSQRPVTLTSAIPVQQGIVLFSGTQQFLLFSDTGVLTPGQAVIKSISSYEVDEDVHPVETGTTITFINKSTSYCRVFGMQTQGQNASPVFVDLGKIVNQYIPQTVSSIVADTQNSFIGLYGQAARDIYFYRDYVEGDQLIMKAWYSWKLPGNVQFFTSDKDKLFSVVKFQGGLSLITSELNNLPTLSEIAANTLPAENLFFDMISTPLSKTYANYGQGHNQTRVQVPFAIDSSLTPVVVSDGGLQLKVASTSTAGGNNYFIIEGTRDYTSLNLKVGYKTPFEIDLPHIFVRRNEGITDYSAYLVISRVKFSIGLSGNLSFRVTPLGESSQDLTGAVQTLDYTNMNAVPLDESSIFTIPVLRRNTSYDMKIFSDTPFAVAINSAMWEGNYSTKYYRRL
tara:strand:+ start:1094 stop:3160 length:2067 start_codon:yes stop_codon:yes gene_type:complete